MHDSGIIPSMEVYNKSVSSMIDICNALSSSSKLLDQIETEEKNSPENATPEPPNKR
jgi:hypothetical protein